MSISAENGPLGFGQTGQCRKISFIFLGYLEIREIGIRGFLSPMDLIMDIRSP